MQLYLIKDQNCPTCGAETISESCTHRHCNGQGFEERTFKCGCRLAWSPNFERLEIRQNCPKDPDLVAAESKRKKLLEQIQELIKKSNVDDQYKSYLINRLS